MYARLLIMEKTSETQMLSNKLCGIWLFSELWLTVLQQAVKHDDWARELCGTLCQFEDGARVSKISLHSDFSAVHLSMLPPRSSSRSVADMLAEMGFAVPVECVRIQPQEDSVHCSANIIMEDPSFAEKVCTRLKSSGGTGGTTPQICATPTNVPMPRGSNSRRVDHRKIRCSWYKPFRTAWLNFGDQGIAEKVKGEFDAGTYKVLDQQVKSSSPSGNENYHNRLAWSLMLTDVPGAASRADILRPIPPAIRPRHIELGIPSYSASLAYANERVKSVLSQCGGLEQWEDAAEGVGKRAKAKARFRTEEDARRVAVLMNGTPLPFNLKGKLTVQLVCSAKLKIPERIYKAVQQRLESESRSWKSQHLIFIPFEPTHGYRTLKLEGEDSDAVAQAINTLQKILGGEIAMHEGKTLWTSSLGINGESYQMLADIERRLNITIVRDRRKCRLQMYGPPEQCARAQRLIVDITKNDMSKRRIIELNHQEFLWVCQGGFKTMSMTFGSEVLRLDIAADPKQIIVTGSDKDYNRALSMVNERKQVDILGKEMVQTERDCVICWTEAENPVRTRCKHTYCADCFEGFCFSGSSGNKEFCTRCEGDSGKCMTVIALAELQEHLSSSTFEDLLEASLDSYIRRHPGEFEHCPTADCGQVYRATSKPNMFTCSNCLKPICTACKASHPDMTCAEHKDRASGGYEAFERAKKQLGIKDCPKCKTSMEKTDGCNHMTCQGCEIHICWECMKTFEKPGPCYDHMREVHRSIGLEYLALI